MFGIVILLLLYFIPLVVAAARSHNVGGVAIVNVLLGWTVIGWIAALIMACGNKTQAVTVIQQAAMPAIPAAPSGGPAPRFDQYTGAPLQPQYDPHTGEPLTQQLPAASSPATDR
jgi:Superinfection immunity protein